MIYTDIQTQKDGHEYSIVAVVNRNFLNTQIGMLQHYSVILNNSTKARLMSKLVFENNI